MPVRLVVNIHVPEENLPRFHSLIEEIVTKSGKEDGCKQYQYFYHPTKKQDFVLIELWENEEALANHEKSEHFVRIVPEMHNISNMTLEKYIH